MLRNPQPVLQAIFDNVRLHPFDDCESRMVVLNPQQFEIALEMAVEEFGLHVPPETVRPVLRYASPKLSFGIVSGDLLIGAYLVSESQLRLRGHNLPSIENRPALQGEALVVHPFARGMGFGQILRQMLPEIGRIVGADYVWGGALVELDNLNHWLRRRVLVRRGEGPGAAHVTLEPLAPDLKEAFLPLAAEPLRDRWMGELGLNTVADDSLGHSWPFP